MKVIRDKSGEKAVLDNWLPQSWHNLRSQTFEALHRNETQDRDDNETHSSLFASTAILFSSPSAMAEQSPLPRPFISSNSNTAPQLLAQADVEATAVEDNSAGEEELAQAEAPAGNPAAEELKKAGTGPTASRA